VWEGDVVLEFLAQLRTKFVHQILADLALDLFLHLLADLLDVLGL
jgi:hypothetical protein